jgi:uncharacterized protein YqfB (UPF0267 family)
MELHILKSWSMFFQDIVTGQRTSDIRSKIDRRFVVGDLMELNEFDPVKFVYTGKQAVVQISYIQTNKSNPCAISAEALHPDYTVLSIKLVQSGTLTWQIYQDLLKEKDPDKLQL